MHHRAAPICAASRRAQALLSISRMTARRWLLVAGALAVLLLMASVVALFFVDEPLRRYTETKMNASLIAFIAGLVENAFFKAILPGFDAPLRRSHR